jgi:hypothetical protein
MCRWGVHQTFLAAVKILVPGKVPMPITRSVLKSFVGACVLGLTILNTSPAAASSILLTTDPTDVLTRVQTDTGDLLEFLDLTATDGSSVSAALTNYSGSGFRWTNGSEAASLLDAFGITYAAVPNDFVTLEWDSHENITKFVSYLGDTGPPEAVFPAALGWVDDLTTTTAHTYLCVGSCAGSAFTKNTTEFWPAEPDIGVFLVRDAVPVPEPATALLVFAGAMVLLQRRRFTRPK